MDLMKKVISFKKFLNFMLAIANLINFVEINFKNFIDYSFFNNLDKIQLL